MGRVRRLKQLRTYEVALHKAGLGPVAGVDEAGRGACFGPITIAAASVLAKVSRDRLIAEMDEAYPGYGLAGHKGYGTKVHMDAVRRHGATPEHRYSYANVKEAHEVYTKGVL